MSSNPVQKAFGAGDTRDDEILYGSASPVSRSEGQRLHQENVDSLVQQKDDDISANPGGSTATPVGAHGEQEDRRHPEYEERDTDTGDEPKKRGLISKLLGKSDKETPRDIPYEKWREEHGVAYASPAAAAAASDEVRRKQSGDARIDADQSEDSEKKGGLLSKLRGSKSDKDDKSREASSEQHREGAGVAAVGTAGAAGVGGLAYEEHRKTSEDPGEDSQKKGGLLSKFRSSKNKDSESSTAEPTAHDNELGQGATVAGAGALGATGVGAAAYESHPHDDAAHQPNPRVNTHDDVSRATYTERAHHLGSNEPTSSNVTAVSQPPPTADTSHLGRDAALAGAGTAVVGGGAYAATRGHDQPTSANVTAASHPPPETSSTYTERSYPLAAGSEATPAASGTTTGDSHLGRDAALGGAGAAVVGGGAYAATRDREVVAPETTSAEIMQRPRPEQMDSVSKLHVPGEFPREDGMDPHADSGVSASNVAPVAVAAAPVTLTPVTHTSHTPTAAPLRAATIGAVTAGAGGAAAASSGFGEEGAREVGHSNRQRFYGRPEARSHIIPTQPATAESHTGRDAALIGAGAAGAGALGVGAVEARRDVKAPQGPEKFNHPPPGAQKVEPHETNVRTERPEAQDKDIRPEQPKHDYGRDGALAAATAAAGGAVGYEATRHDDNHGRGPVISPDDNRVSVDADGRHHLHKKSEDQPGEKKPGFLSKLLHRDKNRKDGDEPDSPGSSSREYAHQQQSSADAVTAAQTASSGHPLAEGGTGNAAAGSSGGQYMTAAGVGLPVGEDGLIHIVNEGAHPDAPALIMKHDGSEVFQHKQDL